MRSGGVWEITERRKGQGCGCMRDQDEEEGNRMMKSSVNKQIGV